MSVCKTLLKFNPEQADKNTHAVFHEYCLNLYNHKKINLYEVGIYKQFIAQVCFSLDLRWSAVLAANPYPMRRKDVL